MAATTIVNRQIADGAINNAKIAAGAAIDTSKLADGANFIKKDGSVTMTGSLNMGSQSITNVATPSSGNDAANKSYVDTQITNITGLFTSKGTVRVATTANITLSGTQTIDGVSVIATNRVLVKNQTAPAQNGIYVCAAGSWARASDMDLWAEVPGAWVTVQEGSTNADTTWLSTADSGGTLETTAISWSNPIQTGGLTGSNFVDKEVPSGSINGSNAAFVLANTPTAGSEHVYLNGVLQESGAGNDYTISSATLTFTVAPITGEKIRVSYRK